MSGGVDSSVAAHLLLAQGHEVVGVFMRHGEQSPVAQCCSSEASQAGPLAVLGHRPDHKQGCCSASDAEDARRVADRMDIPFYALNLQREFGRIIDYFVDEYTGGRTPNPSVMCNNWLKFGRLLDYADDIGAEFVATGHYARLISPLAGSVPELHCGVDVGKDQSYVLFGIPRANLQRMRLPVGDYGKPEIRRLAAELGLRVAEKRDSQEICFVTSGKHDRFIRQRLDGNTDRRGEIVTTDGRVVGEHQGIEAFTIGQRKGLGVAMGEPYFVIRIEPSRREVVIGRRDELARTELLADQTNWLVDPPGEPFRCRAKIRYNAAAVPATAYARPDGRLHVEFDQPCYGVAPGQAVVCYDGTKVLGGGWIE
ncbi:MAG: tRNA 2-thiouridine(34) synthase MnmA [Planctomycetes bacterium]|nr:tRNA 2-thiouridine(34) synthase MnmA [Planctomycetota bacterium]